MKPTGGDRPGDATAKEQAPDEVVSPSGEEEEPGIAESGHREAGLGRRRASRSEQPVSCSDRGDRRSRSRGLGRRLRGHRHQSALRGPDDLSIDGGRIGPTTVDVLGIISMVVWSLTVVVSIKYVAVVLRADNNGEGGVLALAALVRRALGPGGGRGHRRDRLGRGLPVLRRFDDHARHLRPLVGARPRAAGPRLGQPGRSPSAVILAALFVIQARGTQRIGSLFGPVMVCWFVVIGVAGARGISLHPGVLAALSPTYAFAFVGGHPGLAFVSMGAVVLAVTGAEALYADVGHFGKAPIRLAWFALVFPALTVNYLGQAALLLRDRADKTNPFFLLMPQWARLPSVVLATAATIIASQAVISGTYSMTRQAVQLGFLPPMEVRHTSRSEPGDIYMPAVNWLLFVGVLILVLTFRSSSRLAGAYGIAVTGTFLTTTCMLVVLAGVKWHWPTWRLLLMTVVFAGLEVPFFAGNVVKVVDGGWSHPRDRRCNVHRYDDLAPRTPTVVTRLVEAEGTLDDLLADLASRDVLRVPGTAIFPHSWIKPPPGAARQRQAEQHPAQTRHHHLRRGQ